MSAGLLESVPRLSRTDMEAFRDGDCDPTRLADEYADRLQATERFRDCDLELLRVMLHLERQEPQVRSRALMWLRCQEMRPQDREWIGGAVPRTDDADPVRMLRHLAKLTGSVHGVPLVLLIDQLEDMANQSAPVERFRKMVDAITAFTENIPNAVVVQASLEDYFKENVEKLVRGQARPSGTRPGADPPARLPHDRGNPHDDCPAARLPLRDGGGRNRSVEQSVPVPRCSPGTSEQLPHPRRPRLSPPTPPALHYSGPMGGAGGTDRTSIRLPSDNDLDALWNDFHSAFQATVPDGEEELAAVLADAIRAAEGELPDGFHFGCESPDGRYLEVETHKPDNSIGQLLVTICNKSARGGALGKQLVEVEKRVGDFPVALVRTTDFPSTKGSQVVAQIARLLKRDGRRVVVADADWRRMMAFEAFRKQQATRSDFAAWQRAVRPLGELDSLQKILRLSDIAPIARPAAVTPLVPSPPSPPRIESTGCGRSGPSDRNERRLSSFWADTLSLSPAAVEFEPNEFTQHAAFLGGTGSGKTTAALHLIEQLLARDVPAVLLDRKGDLCRYADPAAWNRPLGDPAHALARQSLQAKLDVALFTPGEPTGRPLALPVVPPGFDQLPEADRERFAQYAAAALGSMIGFKSTDRDKGQRAILAKAIETLAAVPGAAITVPSLRDVIEQQDDALLNAIGGGYPDAFYATLAQRLLTLELNNRQLLTADEQLDVDALLGTGPHARPGRVRLSIISTRFLGDAAKVDFWVSQLLVAVSRWCAKSPQPRLQAVFLFDEADVYLPAGTRQPATKAPMEDLLKRARSAGVGVFLATQSPGDFDYKCKENVRTWFIGRVKETRAIEKLKPMLAAAKGDVTDKLAGQATGEFYLVRESSVTAVRSDESLVRTEQLAEKEIVELARLSD